MVSVLKSIFPIPRSDPLQTGPYSASTPLGGVPVRRAVPPAAAMAAGTAPAVEPPPGAADPAALAGTEEAALAGAEESALAGAAAAELIAGAAAALPAALGAAAALLSDELDDGDVVEPVLHPARSRIAPVEAIRAVRR